MVLIRFSTDILSLYGIIRPFTFFSFATIELHPMQAKTANQGRFVEQRINH